MSDAILFQVLQLKKDEEEAEAKALQLAKQHTAMIKAEREKKEELDSLSALLVALKGRLEPYERVETLPYAPQQQWEQYKPDDWGCWEPKHAEEGWKFQEPNVAGNTASTSAPIIDTEETQAWLAGVAT